MQFHVTTFHDVWLIQLEPIHDSRGFFARTFCHDEFAAHGIETHFPQHSFSCSMRKGTLRGMHYQRPPHCEAKLVRCVKGAIWDVVIDIRPGLAGLHTVAVRVSSSPRVMAASFTFQKDLRTAFKH